MVTELRIGVNPIEIAPILEAIPSYKEFQTGAELQASSRQLIEDFPELVESGFLSLDDNFGRSTEGRPIELMTVGKGKRVALWMGTPHPNEAVGTLAIDFLSRHLCEHPEITEELDTTFVFIKNADPDGFALNESWLKGEVDPLKYALGFYRPPYCEEFEWGFPIDYKTLHFSESDSSTETKVLKKALDKYKPSFYYSLHNHAFWGAFLNIDPPIQDLFLPMQKLVKDHGVILHTGEPEMPFQRRYADGIYQPNTAKGNYEYLYHLDGDPADKIQGGERALDYLQNVVPNAIGLVPEVPYFIADAISDAAPSGKTQHEAILEKAKTRERIITFMEEQLKTLKQKHDLPDSPLKHAIEKKIEVIKYFNAARQKELENPEFQQEATNAEIYHAIHITSFYELIQLGQLYQLALQVGEIGQAEEIKQYIQNGLEKINEASPIKAVPIQNLIAIQVGAGLLVQKHLALAA